MVGSGIDRGNPMKGAEPSIFLSVTSAGWRNGARLRRSRSRIDNARITLNPDCGFAPGSAAKVDTDEVYLKLKAEADAARLLRAKYS